MPLNQALLPEFDHEMANTRKSLERVPDDKFGWKPHAKSMTMGALATHLATINHWTDAILGTDSFDAGNAPPNPELKSRKEILEAFDRPVAAARKGTAAASADQLMKPWAAFATGHSILTQPPIDLLSGCSINRRVQPRAQIGVSPRLNGAPVPSSYGPSA